MRMGVHDRLEVWFINLGVAHGCGLMVPIKMNLLLASLAHELFMNMLAYRLGQCKISCTCRHSQADPGLEKGGDIFFISCHKFI